MRNWPAILVASSVAIVGGWAAWFFYLSKPSTPSSTPGDDHVPPTGPGAGMLARKDDLVLVAGDGTPAWGNLREDVKASVYEATPGSATVGVIPQDTRIASLPQTIARTAIKQVLGRWSPNPNPAPGAPVGIRWLGDPLDLETGKTYRARLELSTMEALAATPALVADKFAAVGFTNVQALRASQLDATWPAEATSGATSKSWFVSGLWNRPSTRTTKPAQVQKAWVA